MKLGDAALRVLKARYLLRNKKGEVVETPEKMFRRVANAVARAEAVSERTKYEEEFYALMASLCFIPNSPTLMNAGKKDGQLAACFVLPIEDSISSVFNSLHDAAVIHKSGGGTGFNFGKLRPSGDIVSSSGGRASGPIAFLQIFDHATAVVKQGGTRRGANMAILPINHPDIEKFICSKSGGGVTNFNISVGISDLFFEVMKKSGEWSLINPRDGSTTKSVSARKLWKLICENAWLTGDPGVIFSDTIEKSNPTPSLGPLESTNPCGEQPLLPYESCNLGSISLVPYLLGNDLNWKKLEKDIETSVRFLDDVIEVNSYPLKTIKDITKRNRKIGLGIMGWADALLHWKIPYDSEAALRRAEIFMSRFYSIAVAASERLAVEKGAFTDFKKSVWSRRGCKPRRNATVTTIAPTGTISIIAGVSGGIEPIFSYAHERTALDGQQLVFLHAELGELPKGDLKTVLKTGSMSRAKALSSKERKVFKTAHEIRPRWHVRMQAVFQKYSESAVSKTINLPKTASVSEISRIYLLAHELGCKGITVFREGSKGSQVLTHGVRSIR